MLQTFKDNLEDAKKKEKNTKEAFATLSASKENQLSSAQAALSAGTEEGGARALNKQESQDEVDKLKDQTERDEKFIQQTEDAYAVKNSEWKERKRLRSEEIKSISEAVSILTSDDARDLAK